MSAAKDKGIPIRIGVNSGSLEEDILKKHGYPTAEALYESAMRHVGICDEFGFTDVIISVKSTDVRLMIEAYRLVAERTDIPLHLGVTEAGPTQIGTIKSAVGIGTLLAEGIGDTIRVSLTDEPVKEVEVGKEILRSLGLATRNVELIACPTCGRLEVDLFGIMARAGKAARGSEEAGQDRRPRLRRQRARARPAKRTSALPPGKGVGILYRKGEVVRRVKESEIVDVIVEEVHNSNRSDRCLRQARRSSHSH